MATVNVDQVAGFALVSQPMTMRLDQAIAYALVDQVTVLPYTTELKQHITNSINKTHNLSLTIDHFTMGAAVAVNNTKYNASLHATFLPASGFSGEIDLAFNRAGIADVVVNRNLDTLKYDKVMTRTPQALAVFNTLFGTKLTALDIVDAAIPQDAPCVLQAAPTSIWFVPGSQVSIGVLCPSDRDWELVGLTWPATLAALPTYFAKAAFVTMLNAVVGRTLDPTKVTFGNTAALSTGFGTNREIQRDAAYPSADGLSTLNHKVFYNRLDLAGLSAYTFPTTTAMLEDTTVHHILPAIVAMTGIPFTTYDVEDLPVTAQTSLTTFALTLQAKVDSPLFKGSYVLTVGRKPALLTLFTSTNLGSV